MSSVQHVSNNELAGSVDSSSDTTQPSQPNFAIPDYQVGYTFAKKAPKHLSEINEESDDNTEIVSEEPDNSADVPNEPKKNRKRKEPSKPITQLQHQQRINAAKAKSEKAKRRRMDEKRHQEHRNAIVDTLPEKISQLRTEIEGISQLKEELLLQLKEQKEYIAETLKGKLYAPPIPTAAPTPPVPPVSHPLPPPLPVVQYPQYQQHHQQQQMPVQPQGPPSQAYRNTVSNGTRLAF